ncbi:MAG: L-threonylcarbamoyladenylate synthase [Nitrososphaerales archaeon]
MLEIVSCDSDLFQLGKRVLEGGLVVFPTDTVFGVGSSPMSRAGVSRCFEIKKRKMEKKLPILFRTKTAAERFVVFNKISKQIARKFWPGQLTMILPMKQNIIIPEPLITQDRTLAIRIPDHDCCRKLISACGGSLIGTSANFSGDSPFVDPSDSALLEFAKNADYLVKGSCGGRKLPSTILDLSNEGHIKVVREGAISKKQILDYLEKIKVTELSLSIDRS